jgi:hypothetical protein
MDTPPTGGLIGWMQAFFGGGLTTLIAATLGRLVWHGQEARAGRRPWIGPHLFWEAPTAVVMAMVAESGASWAGLSPSVTTGVVAVVSYLGPRGLRDAVEVWAIRRPKA